MQQARRIGLTKATEDWCKVRRRSWGATPSPRWPLSPRSLANGMRPAPSPGPEEPVAGPWARDMDQLLRPAAAGAQQQMPALGVTRASSLAAEAEAHALSARNAHGNALTALRVAHSTRARPWRAERRERGPAEDPFPARMYHHAAAHLHWAQQRTGMSFGRGHEKYEWGPWSISQVVIWDQLRLGTMPVRWSWKRSLARATAS